MLKNLVLRRFLLSVLAGVFSSISLLSANEEIPLQIILKIDKGGSHPEVFHLDDPIRIGFDVFTARKYSIDDVYREPLKLNNRSFFIFKGNQRVLMPERMENRIYPAPGYNIFSLDEVIKPHGLGEYRIKMVYSYKERGEEKPIYYAATRERWLGEVTSNELKIKVIPILPEKVKRIRNILSDMNRALRSSFLSVSSFERSMDRLIMVGEDAVPYIIEVVLLEMKEQRQERPPSGYSTPFLLKALSQITGEDTRFDFETYRREFEMHKKIAGEELMWKAAENLIQWWQQKVERDGVPEDWLSIRLNENGYLIGDSLVRSLSSVLDALEDENLFIRLNAGIWLKRYAGKDFGYDASSPLDGREEAVAKWRVWYKQQKKR